MNTLDNTSIALELPARHPLLDAARVHWRAAMGSWRGLLHLAAGAELAALFYMTLFDGDLLALTLAGIILIGIGLLGIGTGVLGLLILLGAFGDISVYTVSGALTNIALGEGLRASFLPAYVATVSVTGFLTALVTLVRLRDYHAGRRAAPLAGRLSAVVFLLLLAASFLTGGFGSPRELLPSDLALRTANMAYSEYDLVVDSGEVTLTLTNNDFFWHTFTVDALGVDLKVPKGGTQQITFEVQPGTYEFYCSIPGHSNLMSMRGTLTVR